MPSESTRKPESDYGSDFASDDEQALNQLASGTLAPDGRDSLDLNSVIDAVPGKTDDHPRPDASQFGQDRGGPRAFTQATALDTKSGPRSVLDDDKLEAHVSVSPSELINYPDRVSSSFISNLNRHVH
jgi:hypothetical protein